MTENPATTSPASRGIPLTPDEPRTLADLFLQSAQKFDLPDALNFKADGQWRSITSAKMIERAENIALGLHSLGLAKGDRAAILAGNSPEWTLSDAGCQFGGIVDVPIYTTLSPNSVSYIIKDSQTRVFFIQNAAMYERLRDALAGCGSVEKLIFFDRTGVESEIAMSLDELESAGEELRLARPDLAQTMREAVKIGRASCRERV